jgi:hypothetical protein
MVLESETIIMMMMMMNLYCENPCKKKKKKKKMILYEFWYDVDVMKEYKDARQKQI